MKARGARDLGDRMAGVQPGPNREIAPANRLALGLTGERYIQAAGVGGLDQQRTFPTESRSPCRRWYPILNHQRGGSVQVLGTEENLE